MKPIRELRRTLANIDGALIPFEPEHAEQGDLEGSRQLWGPNEDERALLATADDGNGWSDDDEEPSQPREIEEIVEFAPPSEEDLIKALGGQAKAAELLRSRLLERGVDALGWYVSFHQQGFQWGIYLPVSGLLLTALGAFGSVKCDLSTKLMLAFRLIHQHEIFHFAMDYASAQLELLSGRPCWAPARSLKHPKGYNVREEKLANVWMLRSLWRGTTRLKFKGRSEAVRRFVAAMPEGYRQANDVGRSDFFPEVDVLVNDYARAAGGFDPLLMHQLDGTRLLPFAPAIDWRQCPVHVMHDEKRLNLPTIDIDLLRLIPQLAQTEGFKRELAKLDPRIQKLWPGTEKKLLLDVTIPSLDFKHFDHKGERVYSIRLNKAYRAHLRKTSAPPGWEVFSVGDHQTMGHG